MSVYTLNNLEYLFYRLKSQGMVKMTDVPGLEEILKEISRRSYAVSVIKKRRKRFRNFVANQDPNTEGYIKGNRILRRLEERLEEAEDARDESKRKMNELIAEFLETTLEQILRNRVRIAPKVKKLDEGKYLVSVAKVEEKLICQLLKEDLKRAYKVAPADRNEIVEQLKRLLESKTPKVIIRADIRRFFESVPMVRVIDKLLRDAYLDKVSVNYLQRCMNYLTEKTDFGIPEQGGEKVCGVPRGLAFSSYLAEIFMQQVDRGIEAIEGVYYYRRYVDDIIIIASPDRDANDYWKDLMQVVETGGDRMHLHEEQGKKSLNVTGKEGNVELEYLGYSFKIEPEGLRIGMSEGRKEKYIKRIDVIFRYYEKYPYASKSYREKYKECKQKARSVDPLRELFSMLSCLTGNGHLEGDKRNVSIGSYFSNRHLTDLSELKALDKYLCEKIDNDFNPPDNMFRYEGCDRDRAVENIRDVMRRWTFTEGYNNRRFCKNPKFTHTLGRIKSLVEKLDEKQN